MLKVKLGSPSTEIIWHGGSYGWTSPGYSTADFHPLGKCRLYWIQCHVQQDCISKKSLLALGYSVKHLYMHTHDCVHVGFLDDRLSIIIVTVDSPLTKHTPLTYLYDYVPGHYQVHQYLNSSKAVKNICGNIIGWYGINSIQCSQCDCIIHTCIFDWGLHVACIRGGFGGHKWRALTAWACRHGYKACRHGYANSRCRL